MKTNKKIALQLPKQDFYSFKLCTVDKVHAVRPVDNNNESLSRFETAQTVDFNYCIVYHYS